MFLVCKFIATKNHKGRVTVGDLAPLLAKLKALNEMFTEQEIRGILNGSYSDMGEEIDFEAFLKVSHILAFCVSP